MSGPQPDALVALCLVALRGLIAVYLWRLGFTHISDDDYARVTIAERFAHAPSLDPSGTSWLPAHFWLLGTGLLAFGRTLAAARAVSIALAAASVAPLYFALRLHRISRVASAVGVGLAILVPWNAWMCGATVPEGYVGPLVAAALIALASDNPPPAYAVLLLVATLSRYEAWPAAAVILAREIVRLLDRARLRSSIALRGRWGRHAWRHPANAILAAVGPLAWIAWNAEAHGDPLHFFVRVARYRQGLASPSPLTEKLLGYPIALVSGAPWVCFLGAAGLTAFAFYGSVRRAWTLPIVGAFATLAFLVVGDLGDGAPTHHAARALAPIWFVLATFGAAAVVVPLERHVHGRTGREAIVVATTIFLATLVAVTLAPSLRAWPGAGVDEDRSAAIATGAALRARGERPIQVVPCRYEHFALIAAYGAPEDVVVAPADPAGDACPRIVP